MRSSFIAGCLLAVTALATVAVAKPKPAKPSPLTQNDIRVCMGVDGSTPGEQIVACTKIINSGKVKHPHTADYYATRGAAHFAKREFEKAMADLNKALAIREAPEFYMQRGTLHMAMKDIGKAKADFDQVMKLKPEFAPAFLMRGLVSYEAGEYPEALKHFDAAVQRIPTYYQALFARGVAKLRTGDEGGGKKDMADARAMHPQIEKEMEKFGIAP